MRKTLEEEYKRLYKQWTYRPPSDKRVASMSDTELNRQLEEVKAEINREKKVILTGSRKPIAPDPFALIDPE